MKALAALFLLSSALMATTVSGLVSGPIEFAAATGKVVITWPSFVNGSTSVAAGQLVVELDDTGSFSVYLAPDSLSGTVYTVRFFVTGIPEYLQYWSVIDSTDVLNYLTIKVPGPGVVAPPSTNGSLPLSDIAQSGAFNGQVAMWIDGKGWTPFSTSAVLAPGTVIGQLLAWSGTAWVAGPTFVDGASLGGSQDGTNVSFTLPDTPVVGSVHIYINGIRLQEDNDYLLVGASVTFVSGVVPQSADILMADYRK